MTQDHPPRVRLACQVGVTGHRDLPSDTRAHLRQQVTDVLATIRATVGEVGRTPGSGYADAPPVCTVVSPLAEGADRLAADAAGPLGFHLACPLPFAVEQYGRDFPKSLDEFDALGRRADARLELDGMYGTEAQRKKAYLAAGRLMLDQADVVIALWDPARAARDEEGGTAQIAREARLARIPVVWINPARPDEARVLYCDEDGVECQDPDLGLLPVRLRRLLLPPDLDPAGAPGAAAASVAHARRRYFAEPPVEARRWIARLWRPWWGWFVAGLGRAFSGTGPAERAVAAGASEASDGMEEASAHFRWADALADYYADLYRSSFLINYALGAAAGLFATLGLVDERRALVWGLLELFAILLIVGNWHTGSRHGWRERALEYRVLAEQLRQLHFLRPLGRITPFVRPLVFYQETGSLEGTWMNWHVRAIAREAGMVSARITPAYVEARRQAVADGWLGSQIRYHEQNADRLAALEKNLGWLARAFVVLTFFAVLSHLAWHGGPAATVMAIVFPGLAAVCHGISKQAELQRLVDRSRAMASILSRRREELLALRPDPVTPLSVLVTEKTLATARTMLDEVIDWRIVYQVHEIPLT